MRLGTQVNIIPKRVGTRANPIGRLGRSEPVMNFDLTKIMTQALFERIAQGFADGVRRFGSGTL